MPTIRLLQAVPSYANESRAIPARHNTALRDRRKPPFGVIGHGDSITFVQHRRLRSRRGVQGAGPLAVSLVQSAGIFFQAVHD